MENTTLYIYSQTQIGDHILCYSIIKWYSQKYKDIVLITRELGKRHIDNVKRLYSSLPNVRFLSFPSHDSTMFFINMNKNNKYLIFGHEDYENKVKKDPKLRFDSYFYQEARVPFENKWTDFYLERDLEKEKDIFYNVLKLKDSENFIFIHEDTSREYFIQKRYLDPDIKKIKLEDLKDISIFDLLYTVEKASEVHEINSSMLTLIDLVQIKTEAKLFYHKYVRSQENEQPHLKLNWTIIE